LVGWLKVGGTANLQKPGHNREVRVKVGWLAVFCVFPAHCVSAGFHVQNSQPANQPTFRAKSTAAQRF
jgi:hypothetical protein